MTKIAAHKFGNHVPVLPVVEEVPTDADFVGTPPVGALVLFDDGEDVVLYARTSGGWASVAVEVG